MKLALLTLFCCLVTLLAACDDASSTGGKEKTGGGGGADERVLRFSGNSLIESVWIPDGYEAKTPEPGRCPVWLAPKGSRDGSMVIQLMEAPDPSPAFRDLRAGGSTWRVTMPNPDDERQSADSFHAYIVVRDTAVSVGATGLGWNEADVVRFLSGVRLATR